VGLFLQQWIHRLYKHRSDIALQTEAHGFDVLLKKSVDGVLDVVFLFEPGNLEQLVVSEVAAIPLIMVASRPGLDARTALKEGYILVDWESSFAAAFARHFPDASKLAMRMSIGHVALAFLLECGGSSYFPEHLAAEHLKTGRLYKVSDSPVIDRRIYAVYQGHSERREFVEEALGYFRTNPLPQLAHSSSDR
jgi:DNA-binding transcriptional LysR family regulator